MTVKRLTALIMTAVIFLSILSTPVSAEEADENHEHIEIIFEEDVSEEFKERATYLILSGEEYLESSTYTIACTVIGHAYVTSPTINIIHKKYKFSPRCVKEQRMVSVCTRCDYTTSTVTSSIRIECC